MARSIKRSPLIEMGRKLGKGGLRSTLAVSAVAAPVAYFAAPATQASATPTSTTPLPITTYSSGGNGFSGGSGDSVVTGNIATTDKSFVSFTQSPAQGGGANDAMTFSKSSLTALDSYINNTYHNPQSDSFSTTVMVQLVVTHLDQTTSSLKPISISQPVGKNTTSDLAQYGGSEIAILGQNGHSYVFQPGDSVAVNITFSNSHTEEGNGNSALTSTENFTPYATFTQPDLYASVTLPKATVVGQSQLYDPNGGATEYYLKFGLNPSTAVPTGYSPDDAILTVTSTDPSKPFIYQVAVPYNKSSDALSYLATARIPGLSPSTSYGYSLVAHYSGPGNTEYVSDPITGSFKTQGSLQGAINLGAPMVLANSLDPTTGNVLITSKFDSAPTNMNQGINSVSYNAYLYDETTGHNIATLDNVMPGSTLTFQAHQPRVGDQLVVVIDANYSYYMADIEGATSATVSSTSAASSYSYTSNYANSAFPTTTTPTVAAIANINSNSASVNVSFTNPGGAITNPPTGWMISGYRVDLYQAGITGPASSQTIDATKCPAFGSPTGQNVLAYNCSSPSAGITNYSVLVGNLVSTTTYAVGITPIYSDGKGHVAFGAAQQSANFTPDTAPTSIITAPTNVNFLPGVDAQGNADGTVVFSGSTTVSPSLKLTGYVIALLDQNGNPISYAHVGPNTFQYTFSGLDQAASYGAEVFATYTDGSVSLVSTGGMTMANVAEMGNNNPIAVENLMLSADSTVGSLSATWTNPSTTNTGFIPAGSYKVTLYDSSNNVVGGYPVIVTGTTDRYTFSNLDANNTYHVTVTPYQGSSGDGHVGKSVTSSATSPESIAINGVTTQEVTSTTNPTQSLVVGFNGQANTNYQVWLNGEPAQIVNVTNAGPQSVTFSQLAPGSYNLYIQATQNGNTTTYEQDGVVVVNPPNEVNSPKLVTTATTATLTWNSPNQVVSNVVGGKDLSPVSNYHYNITMVDRTTNAYFLFSTAGNSFTTNVLTPGDLYDFSITSVDEYGNVSPAAALSAVAATSPSAVTNLQLSSDGKDPSGITVNFNAPGSTGGQTITGYEITWSLDGVVQGTASTAANVGSYDISGGTNTLIPGATYTVSVAPTYVDVNTGMPAVGSSISSAIYTVPAVQQASSIALSPVGFGGLDAHLVTGANDYANSYEISLWQGGAVVDSVVVDKSQLTNGAFDYVFSPLDANLSYSVSVTSFSGAGASGFASTPLANTTSVSPYNADVSNVSVTSDGKALPDATVAFDGTTGTTYNVSLFDANGNKAASAQVVATSNVVSTSFTSLQPGIYKLVITSSTTGGATNTFVLGGEIIVAAPNAVSALSATANGSASLNVAWGTPNAVPANGTLAPSTGYRYVVSYVNNSVANSTPINETVTGNSTTLTNLVPGDTYSISVNAIDQYGNSGSAVSTTAIPVAIPSAPTNLSATEKANAIDLSFGAPANSEGQMLTGNYKITYTDTTTNVPNSVIATPTQLIKDGPYTYTIPAGDLTLGHSYTVSVQAEYSDAVTGKVAYGEASTSSSVTIPEPISASSIAVGATQSGLNVTVGAALSTGTYSAPMSYEIDIYASGNTTTPVATQIVDTSSFTKGLDTVNFSNLESSIGYVASVTPFSGVGGSGTPGDAIWFNNPVMPYPAALNNVTLTSANSSASPDVVVSFDPTANTTYEVSLLNSAGTKVLYGPATTTATSTAKTQDTFTSVAPGIYTLEITYSQPGGGSGTYYAYNQYVVAAPNPVSSLSATASGPSAITVNWGAPNPVSTNGVLAPASGYTYFVTYTDMSVTGAKPVTIEVTGTSTTLTGLTAGDQYSISVATRDQYGNLSVPVMTSATAVGLPGTVQDLSLNQVANGLVVNFKAPTETSGQSLTGSYQLTYTDQNSGQATTIMIDPPVASNGVISYAIPGGNNSLMVGDTYLVSVAPQYKDLANGSNLVIGTPVAISAQVIAGPGLVNNLSAMMYDRYLSASWSPSNMGSPATSYIVTLTDTTTNVVTSYQTTATTYVTPSQLKAGDVYNVAVVAVNQYGKSAPATVVAQELNSNIQDVATQVPEVLDSTGHAPTTGTVNVAFLQPASPAGTQITSYSVSLFNPTTNAVVATTMVPASSLTAGLTASFSGIANGQMLEAGVSAITSDGGSFAYDPSNVITTSGLPFAPSNLSASATGASGKVDLSWLAGGDNYSAITDYVIYYGQVGSNGQVTSYQKLDTMGTKTNFVVSGLQNGVQYGFYVVPVNANGMGEASSVVNAMSYAAFTTGATLGPVTAMGADSSANVTFAQVPNAQMPTFYTISYYDTSVASSPTTSVDVPASVVTASGSGAVTYKIAGLTNGDNYKFTVTSYSGYVGNTNPGGSEVVGTATATPNIVPTAPVITTVAGGPQALTVTYTAGISASPVTNYTINAYAPNGVKAGSVTLPANGSVGTINGLVDGTTYKVVVDENTVVGSSPSAPAFGTPYSAPTVANKVATVAPGNAAATINFQAATPTDPASPVAGYEIIYGPTATGFTSTKIVPATEVSLGGNGTITDTIAGLTNGTNYTFQVEAFAGSQGNVNAETNYNPVAATPVAPVAPVAPSAPSQLPAQGYYMVASDGGIFTFGPNLQFHGSLGDLQLNRPIVGMAGLPDASGYWLVAQDGGVFAINTSVYYGSLGKTNDPNDPNGVIGMAANGTKGYWIADSKGYVYGFGNAPVFSNPIAGTVNDIVSIIATPDGGGYYLIGADGGVFAYGDATYYGSLPGMKITPNQPIVGAALTADGKGYYLVGKDGGVFAFGDAQFYGSTGAIKLNAPIVGMAIDPTNGGYDLFAADGGVFTFDPNGANGFYGSMGGQHLNQPIVGGTTY